MVIGIESERANLGRKTGVEHYAKQLILHLARIDHANKYILYLRTAPEQWFLELPKNFTVKVLPFPVFWTQVRLSWEMLFRPVDVLLIPASALPIFHPRKSVVTVHDVGWRYFPDSFTWFMRNFLEVSTRFAVRSSARVIAVSESTKRDLVKFYGVDGGKVSVIHHGYEVASQLVSESASQLSVLPEKYILFLSTLQPRKNLAGLIKAFRELKQQHPELNHKLVVVGKPGWKFSDILKVINDNRDIVVYLNHVSEADKAVILSHSDLLVLPSFYEGFGMQILEAFAAGVPVATSNVSSMPEVAGDAAVYFDPSRTAEIKSAIQNILLDKSLADRLKEKGRQRLKDFSWEKCARETLAALTNEL